jgi:hypothetical protein
VLVGSCEFLHFNEPAAAHLRRQQTAGPSSKPFRCLLPAVNHPLWTFTILILLFGFVLMPTSANSQAVYGSIFGTVFDPSGAAIAGAEITVTSRQKATKFHAFSNTSGNYSITHLIPDAYDVRGQAPGFTVVDLTNIAVFADQMARVDMKLQVGGIARAINRLR